MIPYLEARLMVILKNIPRRVTADRALCNRVRAHPVSPERWHDLEGLFGPARSLRRLLVYVLAAARSEFSRMSGEGNRLALKSVIDARKPAGILGYVQDQPVGWCAVAPREEYPGLQRSRLLKPVDDRAGLVRPLLFRRPALPPSRRDGPLDPVGGGLCSQPGG